MNLAEKIVALRRSGLNDDAIDVILDLSPDQRVAEQEDPATPDPPAPGGGGATVKRALAEQTFTAPFVDTSGASPGNLVFPVAARVPGLTIPVSAASDITIVEVFAQVEYGPHPDNLEFGVAVDGVTWMDFTESTFNYVDVARAAGGFSTLVNLWNAPGVTRATLLAEMGVTVNGFPVGGALQDPWLTLLLGPGDHEIDLGIRTPGAPPRGGQDVQIRNAILAARVVG